MQGYTFVFDLDGTLVETAPDLIAATNHVLAGQGLGAVEDAQLRPAISFGAREMLRVGLAAHGETRQDSELDALLAAFLDHYAANIAVASRPFPGLLAALDRLQAAGGRLAVCTNKRAALSLQLLDALAMTPRFAAVAGRDTFPVHKPHPDHLLGAIRMAHGTPARAVMIGDSDTDIRTARAAGVPVVAVSFGYTDVHVRDLGPDAVIDHYDELVGSLEALLRGQQRTP